MRYRFGLLGPLEISRDGTASVVGAAKRRLFCAALLLRANQVVSLDHLTAVLWGSRRPTSAMANLRTYAHGLRETLGDPGADRPSRLQTYDGGYLLAVEPGELDMAEFERLADSGGRALRAGDAATAAADLSAAVTLWRGRVLADLQVPPALAEHVAHLEEQRLVAVEGAVEAKLALGAAAELVGRLRALLSEHPLRERAWVLLLTALYRSGDVGGALAAYGQARKLLVGETGLEPGPELRSLHDDILHHRAHLRLPTGSITVQSPPAPRELPPDVTPFVGRDAELAAVSAFLTAPRRPPALAIHGAGGAGKSALAVRAAHQAAAAFPGGVLYVDLRGADAGLAPLQPIDVLSRFLRSLGAADTSFTDVAEAAACYRSHLTGRRVLVVLDNAASGTQIRPLLPADPTCAAVVTSRRQLAVSEARHLYLDLLTPEEATALLAAACGDDRVRAEPAAAGRLVRLCGLLPLAVRVVGARVGGRPEWPISRFVERLDDPGRRLDELRHDDVQVRSSLRVGYEAVGASDDPLARLAARAFRLVGGVQLPAVTDRSVAALLGEPVEVATGALELLTDHRLLEPSHPGRYRLHDLLQLYAGELSRAEEPAVTASALERLMRSYFLDMRTIVDSLGVRTPASFPSASDTPGPWYRPLPDRAAAWAWLADERHNLLAAFHRGIASDGALADWALKLMWVGAGVLRRAGFWHESEAMCDATVAHAVRLELPMQYAAALFNRAVGYRNRGLVAEAEADMLRAVATMREVGDEAREAACLDNLGYLRYRMNDVDGALHHHELALRIRRRLAPSADIGAGLANMTQPRLAAGQVAEAYAGAREALATAEAFKSAGVRGAALSMLGYVQCWRGEYGAALASLTEAIAATEETNDLETRWEAYLGRAASRLRSGDRAAAERDAAAAEEWALRVGDRYARAVARYARSLAAEDATVADELRESARRQLRVVASSREPVHEHLFGPLPS